VTQECTEMKASTVNWLNKNTGLQIIKVAITNVGKCHLLDTSRVSQQID